MYSYRPHRSLPTFGGFGGPPPRDLLVLLGVVFVTFSLQFFTTTASLISLLRLTPAVWRWGFLWQLVTYPFMGWGRPSIWFLLELLILFWFGRDLYWQLGRKRFWRFLVFTSAGAGVVAVVVNLLMTLVGGSTGAAFLLMQGQHMLLALLVAGFATLNREAQIYLFFILPIKAKYFLFLEVVLAFMGFLGSGDLAGFLGVSAGVGLAFVSLSPTRASRLLREGWLQLQRRWLELRLGRLQRRRKLRVIKGGNGKPRDPWVN